KDNDKIITWNDYNKMVNNIIQNFDKLYNSEKINRIIILSKNRWELLVLYSVFSSLKIPYIGVDYSSNIHQKLHCLKEVEANLVVYSNEFKSDINELKNLASFNTLNIDETFTKLNSQTDDSSNIKNIINKNSNRLFESISFTSGTSGYPKAVYRTKSFDTKRFQTLIRTYGFSEEDVFLITLPFYHVSVLGWVRLFMNLGCKIVVTDFNDCKNMYDTMIKDEITSMLIVPPLLNRLLLETEYDKRETDLKFMIVGGKNFPADLKQKAIMRFGNIVNEYYGTTETGVNTLSNSKIMLEHPNSSGFVMEGSDIVILDKHNNVLTSNKKGRIAIYSYQNAEGYLHKQLDTVSIENKTYIITADYGYFDDIGRLIVMARSDIMESNGDINLYKLESKIRLISGVKDVFITCNTDKNKEDNFGIFINFDKKMVKIFKKQVVEFITDFMGSNTNVDIHFIPEIPYSLSGKVKVKQLKDLLA
ncbi:class I adenylate-forming enzyme family protein, partial [Bacillus thuringiensis]